MTVTTEIVALHSTRLSVFVCVFGFFFCRCVISSVCSTVVAATLTVIVHFHFIVILSYNLNKPRHMRKKKTQPVFVPVTKLQTFVRWHTWSTFPLVLYLSKLTSQSSSYFTLSANFHNILTEKKFPPTQRNTKEMGKKKIVACELIQIWKN